MRSRLLPPVKQPPPPPLAEQPPPAVAEQPPPPPAAEQFPPPKTVAAPRPKPAPPPRAEAPKLQPRPAPKPVPAARPAETQSRSATAQASRGAASTGASPGTAASAASLSGYIAEVSAAIRSRLFYPPAARARGVQGVVGVSHRHIRRGDLVRDYPFLRRPRPRLRRAQSGAGVSVPASPESSARVSTSFNYVPPLAPDREHSCWARVRAAACPSGTAAASLPPRLERR
jgi:hypothetical protein